MGSRKTEQELQKLRKEDLIKLIQQNDNVILESLEQIRGDVQSMKSEIANVRDICNQNTFKDDFILRLTDLERNLFAQQQYSRRECVEFVNVPDSVPDGNELEDKVLKMCEVAGVRVGSRDFHAIHRLKGKSTVIAKFVNRRDAIALLQNKKSLRELSDQSKTDLNFTEKIYVNESLCGPYRSLLGKCNQLFKSKLISSFWSANGSIRIKMGGRRTY